MAASSASARPQPWEVWLAYLRFADHPETGKVRPVVIIDGTAAAIVVAKVTTAEPQERFSYCELADWNLEGLLKPSRVQVAPLFQLAPSDLLDGEPLGVLTERDRWALSLALMPEGSPLSRATQLTIPLMRIRASARGVTGKLLPGRVLDDVRTPPALRLHLQPTDLFLCCLIERNV